MNERVPGSLAAFARNADYLPRDGGPPVGSAGPKIANFDRVEWHAVPDAATAAAAPQSGEVDRWEQPTTDLLPLLRKDPSITVDIIDTLGYQAVLRFNHRYPPFDNPGVRRGLMGAFSQTDMMQAVAAEDRTMWNDGAGIFNPLSPLANDAAWTCRTARATWPRSSANWPRRAATARDSRFLCRPTCPRSMP